jgi:hypothetical protein
MPWARRPVVRFRCFYNSLLNPGTRWAWSTSFSGRFLPSKASASTHCIANWQSPKAAGRLGRKEGYLVSAENVTTISLLAKSRPSYYSDWAIQGPSYSCLGENTANIRCFKSRGVLQAYLCVKTREGLARFHGDRQPISHYYQPYRKIPILKTLGKFSHTRQCNIYTFYAWKLINT